MEIQPPSSISQANALFTGLSQQQISDCIRRIFPYTLKERTDHLNQPATTMTGNTNDYREKDYIEAHRLLQGIVLHPWRSVEDIEQGKTDIYYHDLGYDDVSDLQSLNVGRVTGAPEMNDPRTAFIGNMLKMKEFQKNIDKEFSYQYMKDLFVTQLDKGSTYYQAQAQKQIDGMSQFMVDRLASIQPLPMNVAIRNVDYGNITPSKKRYRDIVVKSQPFYTQNVKRARLDHIYNNITQNAIDGTPDDLENIITDFDDGTISSGSASATSFASATGSASAIGEDFRSVNNSIPSGHVSWEDISKSSVMDSFNEKTDRSMVQDDTFGEIVGWDTIGNQSIPRVKPKNRLIYSRNHPKTPESGFSPSVDGITESQYDSSPFFMSRWSNRPKNVEGTDTSITSISSPIIEDSRSVQTPVQSIASIPSQRSSTSNKSSPYVPIGPFRTPAKSSPQSVHYQDTSNKGIVSRSIALLQSVTSPLYQTVIGGNEKTPNKNSVFGQDTQSFSVGKENKGAKIVKSPNTPRPRGKGSNLPRKSIRVVKVPNRYTPKGLGRSPIENNRNRVFR